MFSRDALASLIALTSSGLNRTLALRGFCWSAGDGLVDDDEDEASSLAQIRLDPRR